MIVFVAGTTTGVGKTWVVGEIASILSSAGLGVRAYKPAQSFDPSEGTTDADVLAAATGQRVHDICPAHRWYPVAFAPPMAADHLGSPSFNIDELAAEVPPAGGDVLLVEGAGGIRSPLATDGDNLALIDRLLPDLIVLVADAELGTLNAVRLSQDALAGRRVVVFMNRYDAAGELHRRNLACLRDDGYDVTADLETLAKKIAEGVR